jgi:hypothetical protein
MDLRKVFGSVLTLLGIIGLVYAAYIFLDTDMDLWVRSLVIFIISSMFFTSGISLIKEAERKKDL